MEQINLGTPLHRFPDIYNGHLTENNTRLTNMETSISSVASSHANDAQKLETSFNEMKSTLMAEIDTRLSECEARIDGRLDGSINASAVTRSELTAELRNYALKTELNRFATTSVLGNYSRTGHNHDERYVKKSDFDGRYALKTDIPSLAGYVTTTALNGRNFVTQSMLDNYVTDVELAAENYLTSDDLSGYVTSIELNNYARVETLRDNYLSKTDANNTYLLKSGLNGYLTTTDAAKTYAKVSDLSSYVKRSELSSLGTGGSSGTGGLSRLDVELMLGDYVLTSTFENKLNDYVKSSSLPNTKSLKYYVLKSDYDALLARVVALENNQGSGSGTGTGGGSETPTDDIDLSEYITIAEFERDYVESANMPTNTQIEELEELVTGIERTIESLETSNIVSSSVDDGILIN